MIIGKKCILTAMTKDDIKQTLEWVNDPDYRYWNGTVFPVSEIEHIDFMIDKVKSSYNKTFTIKDKETMESIGFAGIKNADLVNSNCEIYGSIGRDEESYIKNYRGGYLGRGYGAEAFLLLSEFCLYELNIHKIYSKVYAYNDRSYKAFIKAGFHEEAKLREHHFVHGKYCDVFIMSKLRC